MKKIMISGAIRPYSVMAMIILPVVSIGFAATSPTAQSVNAQPSWVSTVSLPSFHQALAALTGSAVPIMFPACLPSGKYFIFATHQAQGYALYFDATATCHGAKYCNRFTLLATNGDYPIIYSDRYGHEMTTRVLLSPKQSAYYTQGFALADFQPPSIAWRVHRGPFQDTLYTLSDNRENATKAALIALARHMDISEII